MAALETLTTISGSLYITDNPLLSQADVDDWCTRYTGFGYCEIARNAP